MATKITLTIDETLDVNAQHKLRNLLCDAFAEFATRRSPPEQYVEERYPVSGGYDWMSRPEKVEETKTRIARAKQLHAAVFDATFFPQHVNHAICVATKKPCSPTCYAEGEQTLREIEDDILAAAGRAQARMRLLQEMFGMTEEEAQAAFNQLEDKRISKRMVAEGHAKRDPYSEKRRLFEMALAHECMHNAVGNPPDLVTLVRLLKEVFS